MKKSLSILIAFLLSIFNAYAQEDNTHVTVHAGETPIEQQLSDEQKAAVTHLSVTGTLQDADYAYLRETLFKQLHELNLRDADIDTIPARAFRCSHRGTKETGPLPNLNIICPVRLKFLGKASFDIDRRNLIDKVPGCSTSILITGRFPRRDGYISYNEGDLSISNDNPYLVLERDIDNPKFIDAIYSADKDTLFYSYQEVLYAEPQSSKCNEIKEGTKVIAGYVFEDLDVVYRFNIPSSVDSIGDCALRNLCPLIATGTRHLMRSTESDYIVVHEGVICCYAPIPPKLGKEVFLLDGLSGSHIGEHMALAVPDGSVELYEQTEGWNGFYTIVPLSKLWITDVQNISTSKDVKITYQGNGWKIVSAKTIQTATCYNLRGQMVYKKQVDAETCVLEINQTATELVIIELIFEDGTKQTIKTVVRP